MRVYTASKLSYAEMWLKLTEDWPEITFTARWPHLVGDVPDDPCIAPLMWDIDFADIDLSDVVLVYAVGDDRLRGALVEAGYAIAKGKPVLIVGEHQDYGTWQYHKNVHRLPDLDWTRLWLRYAGENALCP